MKYLWLISILVLNIVVANGMQLAQAAQKGEAQLKTLIEQRNYNVLQKILEIDNPPWFDEGMHHRLKVFALNEFERYGEQKKLYNTPRIILATTTLFLSALSFGIAFFDSQKEVPFIANNILQHCAKAFGMLGLKFCFDIFLIRNRTRQRYEQAGTVYAIFASKSKALKKFKTETDIPQQKGT